MHPINKFKRDLGKRQQMGIWSTMGSPALAELLAGCGFDWILIDTEHSPIELPDIIDHMRAVAASGISVVVRPAWNDMVSIKRVLDQGAQSILLPYIQNAKEAAQAVSYLRYPPHGVRGVSGGSRAANYGLTPQYFKHAEAELCLIVQIETTEALAQIEEIALVPGVDAVFIGPADLAASMGQIGNSSHPDVQAAIDSGFRRLKAIGKPCGYLTTNEDEVARRIQDGIDFISLNTDGALIVKAATGLVQRVRKI